MFPSKPNQQEPLSFPEHFLLPLKNLYMVIWTIPNVRAVPKQYFALVEKILLQQVYESCDYPCQASRILPKKPSIKEISSLTSGLCIKKLIQSVILYVFKGREGTFLKEGVSINWKCWRSHWTQVIKLISADTVEPFWLKKGQCSPLSLFFILLTP